MAEPTSLVSQSVVRGAYKSSQSLVSRPADAAEATGAADRKSFAEVLREASADAIHQVRASDSLAQAGIKGEADTQSVVEATIALESTVKMAVAIRDKFVQAYQEVMRMPI